MHPLCQVTLNWSNSIKCLIHDFILLEWEIFDNNTADSLIYWPVHLTPSKTKNTNKVTPLFSGKEDESKLIRTSK